MTTAATEPSRKRRFFRPRLFLQIFLFIIVVANLELFCLRSLRNGGYETGAGMARPDPVLGWVTNPGGGKNSDGLWGPEVPSPRPPNEFRIFCLGGSVTAGWGVTAVTEAYAKRLEELLQAKAPPGITIRVINGGVAGYSIGNAMYLLARLGPRYQPNLVTMMSAYNETSAFEYRPIEEGRWQLAGPVNRVRSLLYHSATYRYFRCRLLGTKPFEPSTDRSHEAISLKNLEWMNNYMASHDGRLVFIFEAQQKNIDAKKAQSSLGWRPAPFPFREGLRTELKQFCQERGVPYIDLDPILRQGGRTEEQNFLDVVHLTREGHQIAAAAIARTLWEHRLVPMAEAPR